jgi:hypothetical protein
MRVEGDILTSFDGVACSYLKWWRSQLRTRMEAL